MKVLRLWHAAVVSEYRKKVRAIAALPDVELCLLIPPAWREGGQIVHYTPDAEIDDGFEVRTGRILHPNNIRRYRFVQGLVSTLLRFKPDIVDMEEEPFSAVVHQVMRWCRVLNIPAKFIYHSAHNISDPMQGLFGRYEKYAIRHGHGAVARNAEAAARIRSMGFKGPVARIGNGIDLSRFSPEGSREVDSRIRIQGKRVVGYVGKLRTGKGVMDLVAAFQSLPNDTHLLLVGDGHLRSDIEQLGKGDPKIMDRIWITGAVPHSEVANYYRAMDALVLPSRTERGWKESFGRVLIEAMACGTPVVGSDSGAIPSTIGEAGLTYPEGNVDDLANRLCEVLHQDKLHERLRQNGFKQCRQFSWGHIAERHGVLYHEIHI